MTTNPTTRDIWNALLPFFEFLKVVCDDIPEINGLAVGKSEGLESYARSRGVMGSCASYPNQILIYMNRMTKELRQLFGFGLAGWTAEKMWKEVHELNCRGGLAVTLWLERGKFNHDLMKYVAVEAMLGDPESEGVRTDIFADLQQQIRDQQAQIDELRAAVKELQEPPLKRHNGGLPKEMEDEVRATVEEELTPLRGLVLEIKTEMEKTLGMLKDL